MKKWEIYFDVLNFRAYDFFPRDIQDKFSASNFYLRCIRCVKYYVSYLKSFLFSLISISAKEPTPQNHYWLFAATKNQEDCLMPIKKHLPEAIFVGTGYQRENEKIYTLSLHLRWVYSHSFWIILLQIWRNESKRAKNNFDYLMQAMGLYECFCGHIKNYRPKAIILANDHYYVHRALLFAAKSCSVPVIYVQHASVSNHFPPLKFDLSLLEGQDSLDKYKVCGNVEGEVAFIGMPKLDGYHLKRNSNKVVRNIGICCGPLDNYEKIIALVESVTSNTSNVQFCFRSHPGDTRNFNFEYLKPKLTISNPRTEKALEFLTRHDMVIAGNSSIHLEAVLLNVESLYYRMDEHEKMDDYYGFVENGLSIRVDSLQDVHEIIEHKKQKKDDVYHKAKYYNHLIDTPYEGQSAKLAAEYIQMYLKDKSLPKDSLIHLPMTTNASSNESK